MSQVELAFIGGLREDYALLASGEARLRELGGSAIYSAVGAKVWAQSVGLVGRVGANFPVEWLARLAERGFDTSGIKVLPELQDTRAFYAYLSLEERAEADPAAHFARVGLPLPPELASYVSRSSQPPEREKLKPLNVRPADVPADYARARGIHLAPDDLMVHSTLPVMLRHQGVTCITCDPDHNYMLPAFAEEVKHLVRGLDAFLPSEGEARDFLGLPPAADLWQAAEAFAAMGAKVVVIKSGLHGQLLYDAAARRKWHIPAYPAKARDLTGGGDAYCGGFLTGLALAHDPVEAAVRGAVSASMVVEGTGALYALDSLPALAEARARALRDVIRQV